MPCVFDLARVGGVPVADAGAPGHGASQPARHHATRATGARAATAPPSETWTFDDNVSLAAFFAQVQFKQTQEWKEEIVFVNPKRTMRHPRTGELVQPKPRHPALVLAPRTRNHP